MARKRLSWWPLEVMYRKCCLQVSDIFFFRGNDMVVDDCQAVVLRFLPFAGFPFRSAAALS